MVCNCIRIDPIFIAFVEESPPALGATDIALGATGCIAIAIGVVCDCGKGRTDGDGDDPRGALG